MLQDEGEPESDVNTPPFTDPLRRGDPACGITAPISTGPADTAKEAAGRGLRLALAPQTIRPSMTPACPP